MSDKPWYMDRSITTPRADPPKDKAPIDCDAEYTARFAKAKIQAEAQGLSYEHPNRAGVGWKIHLAVPHISEDPLTKRIADFIDGRRFRYKIGNGGTQEEGKGMTIYVGDRDTTEDLAQELMREFSDEIPESRGDALKDDMRLAGNVWARFENTKDQKINGTRPITVGGLASRSDPKYVQYGPSGAPFLTRDINEVMWGTPKLSTDEARRNSVAALTEDYGAFFAGTRDHPI